jgi:sugar phosphate isomerase/epimerase
MEERMRLGAPLALQFGIFEDADQLPTPEVLKSAIQQRAEMGFEHVEISANLLTSFPELLSPRSMEGLRHLKEEHNLTYSIHLHNGLGVDIDSWCERVRRAAVEETIAVYQATRPLEVRHFVLHSVWAYAMTHEIVLSMRLSERMKDVLLDKTREQSRRSLAELVRVIPPRHLCLENLFVDFEWVYSLVEEFDTSICFDGGHWKLLGGEGTEFVRRYGARITLVHCHDVQDGEDHRPLTQHPAIDWESALRILREQGFDGPIVLELKSNEEIRQSLPILRGIRERVDDG